MIRHIFGHKPTPSEDDPEEFEDKKEALEYLRDKLPNLCDYRYLTTYKRRRADSIIFAFDGELLAELVVETCGRATDDDRRIYKYQNATWFYDIKKIREFKETTVRASAVGLVGYHRGKQVSDDIYGKILEKTGGFCPDIEKPLQLAGAGFGDSIENKRVEDAAIKTATAWYESRNWTVKSVERNKCGYDLMCRRNDTERHVEVKGARGSTQQFVITSGEVHCAEAEPHFELFLVTNALASPLEHRYSGQDIRSRFSLDPIQFRAALRLGGR